MRDAGGDKRVGSGPSSPPDKPCDLGQVIGQLGKPILPLNLFREDSGL